MWGTELVASTSAARLIGLKACFDVSAHPSGKIERLTPILCKDVSLVRDLIVAAIIYNMLVFLAFLTLQEGIFNHYSPTKSASRNQTAPLYADAWIYMHTQLKRSCVYA
jgi:hypothetical protein